MRVRLLVAPALILLAVACAVKGVQLLVPLVLLALAAGAALLQIAHWRPERIALSLAVAVVVLGAAAAGARVVDGVDHSRVHYHGKLHASGHILPGVLVLVLAGVFRRGVELRELERQTI